MGIKSEMDECIRAKRKELKMQKMVLECITEHPEYLKIIKSKYLTDDLYEQAIQIEPAVFEHIKEPSIRVINFALDIDGGFLRCLDEEKLLGLPLASFEIAIESNPEEAVKYIPKRSLNAVMTDKRKLDMFMEYPEVIRDRHIKVNEAVIREYILQNPSYIKYVENPSEALVCATLAEDPMVALYFTELTDAMMDVIDANWPQFKNSLPNYTRTRKDETDGTPQSEPGSN